MGNQSKRYPPEMRERQGDYESQWTAIVSVSKKIGYTRETLRRWIRQVERYNGQRAGLNTDERKRLGDSKKRTGNSNARMRFCAWLQLFSHRNPGRFTRRYVPWWA